jgi:hypothetical protein
MYGNRRLLDNPASRLLALLECTALASNRIDKIRLLAPDFDFTRVSDTELTRRYDMAAAFLPAEVDAVVKARLQDVPGALRIQVIDLTRRTLAKDKLWGENASLMHGTLQAWAKRLSEIAPEPNVGADDIALILASIDDLLHLFDDGLADPILERFVRDQLKALSQALADVQVMGVAVLYKVIDQSVGGAVRVGSVVQPRQRDTDARRSQFWKVMGRAATLAQIASIPLAMTTSNPPALPSSQTKVSIVIVQGISAPGTGLFEGKDERPKGEGNGLQGSGKGSGSRR